MGDLLFHNVLRKAPIIWHVVQKQVDASQKVTISWNEKKLYKTRCCFNKTKNQIQSANSQPFLNLFHYGLYRSQANSIVGTHLCWIRKADQAWERYQDLVCPAINHLPPPGPNLPSSLPIITPSAHPYPVHCLPQFTPTPCMSLLAAVVSVDSPVNKRPL